MVELLISFFYLQYINIQLISLTVYYSYNPVNSKANYTNFTVWALPISLVTTTGISFDFFSIAT